MTLKLSFLILWFRFNVQRSVVCEITFALQWGQIAYTAIRRRFSVSFSRARKRFHFNIFYLLFLQRKNFWAFLGQLVHFSQRMIKVEHELLLEIVFLGVKLKYLYPLKKDFQFFAGIWNSFFRLNLVKVARKLLAVK